MAYTASRRRHPMTQTTWLGCTAYFHKTKMVATEVKRAVKMPARSPVALLQRSVVQSPQFHTVFLSFIVNKLHSSWSFKAGVPHLPLALSPPRSLTRRHVVLPGQSIDVRVVVPSRAASQTLALSCPSTSTAPLLPKQYL